jgi:hypothetical protein
MTQKQKCDQMPLMSTDGTEYNKMTQCPVLAWLNLFFPILPKVLTSQNLCFSIFRINLKKSKGMGKAVTCWGP